MIIQRFREIVQQNSCLVAIQEGHLGTTYATLDLNSERVASYLSKIGIVPGQPIGIFMERSTAFIIAILGVFKAQGVYVPIDVTYSLERALYIADDSHVSVVITHASHSGSKTIEKLKNQGIRALLIDDLLLDLTDCIPSDIVSKNSTTSREIICIIYTSGTTGHPKGILVPQSGVKRLVVDSGYIDFTPDDVVGHGSNCSFDASLLEIWGALLNGAKLVILNSEMMSSGSAFDRALADYKINIQFLTPALFNQFILEGLSFQNLDYLLLGGEALTPSIVRRCLTHSAGRPKNLINGYGPTETTTFATAYSIDSVPEGLKSIPIGKPIADTQVYILDDNQQPVPPGMIGELYIGGAGVAQGYINKPELTAERFITNPFDPKDPYKLYKTGDYVCLLPDGNLDFVGRKDNQVKIRGHRIELEEVEKALRDMPEVAEACVFAHDSRDGRKQLIAYIVPFNKEPFCGIPELKSKLKMQLPAFMIPSGFVVLSALPINCNGKVDREKIRSHYDKEGRNLLTQTPFDQIKAESVTLTEIEHKLIAIWSNVLDIEVFSIHDSFFDLGGDSIMAIDLSLQLEKTFNLQFGLEFLFECPTISILALKIKNSVKY